MSSRRRTVLCTLRPPSWYNAVRKAHRIRQAVCRERNIMSVVETVVGSGKYTYEVHEDWAQVPAGWDMPAAAVTVDAQDRVYCFNRTKDHPVIVFDRDGNYLSSWGAGVFAFPHTIRADENDNLWLVDRDHGQMMLRTSSGKLLRTIGTRGYRSDTGLGPDDTGSA